MTTSDDNEPAGGEEPTPAAATDESEAPTAETPIAESAGVEPNHSEPEVAGASPAARRSVTIQAPRRATVLVATGVAAAFVLGAVVGGQLGDGRDEHRVCSVPGAPWMACGPGWFDGKVPPGFDQRPDGFGDRGPFRERNDRGRFDG